VFKGLLLTSVVEGLGLALFSWIFLCIVETMQEKVIKLRSFVHFK
jgi:hypothetical protein